MLSRPARLAFISFHTSPAAAPGAGDAGGMNVYVRELARALGARGVAVDVYTRATTAAEPPAALTPGVRVVPIAGAFAAGVLAAARGTCYAAVHAHYWQSA